MDKIILLNAIVGSQAYGTNTPDSDIDMKGVYLQNPMEILGMDYKEQINIDKDTCLYEIRRFYSYFVVEILLCWSYCTFLKIVF